MKRFVRNGKRVIRNGLPRLTSLAIAAVLVWTLIGAGVGSGGALATGSGSYVYAAAAPSVTCPGGQCFEDVPSSNPFYAYINSLYQDNIIGGYTCGGVGEPCVSPNNRPYYRPNNNVTRAQMSKFVDNGRRNIADAIGTRLVLTNPLQIAEVISSTTTDSLDANNASGAEAVQSICTRANQNCWAFYSSAPTGDYAGVFAGGRGVNATSADGGFAAVDASASNAATGSYGLHAQAEYRGGYVKSNDTGLYSLYVDTQGGPTQGTAGLEVNGSIRGEGNLYIAGSKAGYVVDIMQNVDTANLQPGDVVRIVGNSAPVLGQIPAVTVKKATTAYDTGVVGIVDQVMYVPDAATKATYDREQAALKAAMDQRSKLMASATAENVDGPSKPDPSSIPLPQTTISEDRGVLHAVTDATEVAPNGYMSVVTLGSYKMVKVDASFGAIHPGDLLVSSTHAGYAMKATDRALASGATLGKALGALDAGTGMIPVMVTLK